MSSLHRDAQRPLLAVSLGHVVTSNQLRPVPLLLQPLHQCLDMCLQLLCIRVPRHAIHPTGRVLMQVAPAVQQELDVQAPVEVPKSVLLVGLRLSAMPCREVGWRASGPTVSGARVLCRLRPSVTSCPWYVAFPRSEYSA